MRLTNIIATECTISCKIAISNRDTNDLPVCIGCAGKVSIHHARAMILTGKRTTATKIPVCNCIAVVLTHERTGSREIPVISTDSNHLTSQSTISREGAICK